MSITRYHPPRDGEGQRNFKDMTKGATGDYVTYGDHLARVTDLRAEITKLKAKLAKLTEGADV